MFVELPAAFLGAISLAGLVDGYYPRNARPALVLLVLICLVPLAQLLPLPAHVWAALPGHATPAEVSRLVGLGDRARPLSLAPEQTKLGALSLIVPAALFITTLQLGASARDRLLLVIVAFAFVSAIFGVFQVAAGGGIHLDIYRQVHEGYPVGFFANRNHEGDLLLIALPACAHLIRTTTIRERAKLGLLLAAVLFLSMAVVSTQSRTAFSLLPLALGGVVAVWFGDVRHRRVWIGFAVLLATLLIGFGLIEVTPVGQHLVTRFSTVGDDLRPIIWRNSWVAVYNFWPAGSGVGSFVPVYQMFEDLDWVGEAWANHAHNDYIEILLETGIAGAVLMTTFAILAGLSLLKTASGAVRGQRYVAVSMILILLAHSLTDYPLRTFALLSVFAIAAAMLYVPRERGRCLRQGSYPTVPPPGFGSRLEGSVGVVG
jgi:O-antigen ligase